MTKSVDLLGGRGRPGRLGLLLVPLVALAGLAGLASSGGRSTSPASPPEASARWSAAPEVWTGPGLAGPDVIDGSYLVVLDTPPGAVAARSSEVEEVIAEAGGQIDQRYQHALHGFAVSGLSGDAVAALVEEPAVALVEPNRRYTVTSTATEVEEVSAGPVAAIPWGLDRIDQRSRELDGHHARARSGAGVTVYVVDTGVSASHVEFSGRMVDHVSFVEGVNDDCNGHGTHVAGIVAGQTFGVAVEARLVGVKAFDCAGDGTTATVAAALEWVAEQASGPSVANLSLSGPSSDAIDRATQRLAQLGVITVSAAGNGGTDACESSPAHVISSITVGATTPGDTRSALSNWGPCLDLFAPGVEIPSAWIGSDTATAVREGTSMAAAHVSGAVAAYLEAFPTATVAEVEHAIEGAATRGVVVQAGDGSPNLLLFAPTSNDPDPTGGTVEGRVTGPAGEPQPGVTVELWAATPAGQRAAYLGSTPTDDGGRFQASALQPGCYGITFVTSDDRSFSTGHPWSTVVRCLVEGEVVGGVDEVLHPRVEPPEPGAIHGSVTGPDGVGVGGVLVDLFRAGEGGDRSDYLGSTTTDDRGAYAVPTERGCYIVTFVAPDGARFDDGRPWRNSPAVCLDDGGSTRIDAVLAALAPSTSIGGQVVDVDGAGVSGVVVDLFTQSADGGRGAWLFAVATDGQGWFGIELVDGCYVVTYIAPTDHSFAGGQRFLNRSVCVEQGQTTTLEPVTLAPTESL